MKHRLVPNRLLPDLFSKGMKSSCFLFTGASTSIMEKNISVCMGCTELEDMLLFCGGR